MLCSSQMMKNKIPREKNSVITKTKSIFAIVKWSSCRTNILYAYRFSIFCDSCFLFFAGFSVVYDARRCCESVERELSVLVYF